MIYFFLSMSFYNMGDCHKFQFASILQVQVEYSISTNTQFHWNQYISTSKSRKITFVLLQV